jgi:outer membrane protein TolC
VLLRRPLSFVLLLLALTSKGYLSLEVSSKESIGGLPGGIRAQKALFPKDFKEQSAIMVTKARKVVRFRAVGVVGLAYVLCWSSLHPEANAGAPPVPAPGKNTDSSAMKDAAVLPVQKPVDSLDTEDASGPEIGTKPILSGAKEIGAAHLTQLIPQTQAPEIQGVSKVSAQPVSAKGPAPTAVKKANSPTKRKGSEQLPPPRLNNQQPTGSVNDEAEAEAAACGIKGAMALSLPVALRLVQTTNLDIAQAREFLNQAQAALERANLAVIPNFNLGNTYVAHNGNIQRTEGNIEKVNRVSDFVGGGPSLSVGVSDAIFLPLAARQVVAASEAGLQRVNNDTLLAVADAYLAVMRARRRLARVEETLEFLTSPRSTASRSQSRGLLPVVEAFYKAGASTALKAEVERVRVEILRRNEEKAAAIQDFLVASAELARLLRLDPAIPLWPVEDFRFPIPIGGDEYLHKSMEELALLALGNRPELAENRALVQAALERVKNAKFRPWLPNLVMNYNWGNFGGGPDLNPSIVKEPTVPGGRVTVITQPGFGPTGEIHHMNTRDDFDVSLVWRLQNMGFGNLAEVRENQAIYRRQELRRLQVQDIVVAQVVQAYDLVVGWRDRLNITKVSLFDEQGMPTGPVFQSLRLNFERIRTVPETRALEVLDSIRSLNDLLEAYGQAVTDYERARFRLLIALGLPPQSLFDANVIHQPGGHGGKTDLIPQK